MAKRKIIKIDRDKCNGCGICTTACAEGALKLDEENKAKLVKEIYCDGLGACLDVCPTGALIVEERESEEYDSKATYNHILETRGEEAAREVHAEEKNKKETLKCGCPGTMTDRTRTSSSRRSSSCSMGTSTKEIKKKSSGNVSENGINMASELTQWPIQLHLISPSAPYFNKSDILIAADCTAFTLGSFHKNLLKGKKLVIACPKLDDTSKYVEKLAELLKNNSIYSLTVAIMTVPCCSGLIRIVQDAIDLSGAGINMKKIVINLEGNIEE